MSNKLTPVLVLIVAVLAVALFVRGSDVLTALAISETNSTASILNITNAAPEVTSVRCFDASDNSLLYVETVTNGGPLSLVGGDFKTIYCNATINDANGVSDIRHTHASVHTYDATGFDACGEDDRNCYINDTCENITDINSTARDVRCTFFLWFNAGNTSINGNWTANITVHDTGELHSTLSMGNRTNFSVDTLLAVGVDSIIAFGAKNAGTNMTNLGSTGTVSATVCAGAAGGCNHSSYNYGNTQIDLQVNASSLTCSQTGSIPAEYIKVSTTYNDAYIYGYPLTANLADSTSSLNTFNLAQNNTASIPNAQAPLSTTGTTYWGVGVPLNAAGNCQGVIHFAAVLG